MEISSRDREQLQRLEESLWEPATRYDREYMEDVLAPDFFEFGRSGRTYDREATLSAEPAEIIHATLPMPMFGATRLEANTVLVTYVSEVGDREPLRTNRASIWSRTERGWRLRFHRGTPRE
jgi:hypothetical protein